LPITPSPDIRFNVDNNTVEVDLKGTEEVFHAANDTITFEDVPFSGNAAALSAKLRELFFLANEGGGTEGGLSEAQVDARVLAVLTAGVAQIKFTKPGGGTVTQYATDDPENPIEFTASA
jgi:hypothetical protein